MRSIYWTQPPQLPDDEVPQPDPDREKTRERPAVTEDALNRENLRQTAEHEVLRSMLRHYAKYYGPN